MCVCVWGGGNCMDNMYAECQRSLIIIHGWIWVGGKLEEPMTPRSLRVWVWEGDVPVRRVWAIFFYLRS